MSRRRRVRYSPEFKGEAIRLMRTTKASLAQLAREMGVSEPTLRSWWPRHVRRLRTGSRWTNGRSWRTRGAATARGARHLTKSGARRVAERRWRGTTTVDATWPAAPNHLALAFTARRRNQVWAGDITAIPTREGRLYWAVLLDVYSRRVVGWPWTARWIPSWC